MTASELERRRITVLLKGPRPEHLRMLLQVGAIDRLAHIHHVFDDLDAAIAHARDHVQRTHPSEAARSVAVSAAEAHHS